VRAFNRSSGTAGGVLGILGNIGGGGSLPKKTAGMPLFTICQENARSQTPSLKVGLLLRTRGFWALMTLEPKFSFRPLTQGTDKTEGCDWAWGHKGIDWFEWRYIEKLRNDPSRTNGLEN